MDIDPAYEVSKKTNSTDKSKRIIICYDGTGNEYGQNNTNVVKIIESLDKDKKQIFFYDPGVGTLNIFGRTIGRHIGILLGKAFGFGLQQNIEDGYEYLMNRFNPCDKVYIFGFSRGAFTARALAGMLHKFGLLHKGNKNLIPYVSKMYKKHNISIKKRDSNVKDKNEKDEIAKGFKQTFSQECKPHFIGVWDTVGSLGYFYGKKFDTKLNHDVKYAYQAIAIDEKRKKFPVNIWDDKAKLDYQVIEQVWFPGVHSDVGGWYKDRSLSDIAFAWLMDKASSCGITLKKDWENSLEQDALGDIHESRKGWWRFWRPVTRVIPVDARIHYSTIYRKQNIYDYKPTLPYKYKTVGNDSYIFDE